MTRSGFPFLAMLMAMLTLLPACSSVPSPDGVDSRNVRIAKEKQEADSAAAIRELLAVGVDHAAARVARAGGYVRNPRVRLRFPEALREVEDALVASGQQALLDDYVTDMNVTAEIIAPKSGALLRASLAVLQVNDAVIIATGDSTAAARAFRQQSETAMLAGYSPLMNDALRRSGSWDSYNAMIDAYNATPKATRVVFDLELYVREHAIDGLYVLIGDEEAALRSDPARQTTPLLRRVFGR